MMKFLAMMINATFLSILKWQNKLSLLRNLLKLLEIC